MQCPVLGEHTSTSNLPLFNESIIDEFGWRNAIHKPIASVSPIGPTIPIENMRKR
jgi:hypothetical protein